MSACPPLRSSGGGAFGAQLQTLARDLSQKDGDHPEADRGNPEKQSGLHLLSGRGLKVSRSLGHRVARRSGGCDSSRYYFQISILDLVGAGDGGEKHLWSVGESYLNNLNFFSSLSFNSDGWVLTEKSGSYGV